MSSKTKAFKASCQNGTVTINGAELPGAVVLSAGKAQSQGVALINGGDAFYIAIPKDTLEQLIGLVSQVVQTVSAGVLASNGGGAITSPTFAADLAQLKSQLDQLKGAMQ